MLKELVAKHFGIKPEDVEEAQIERFQAVIDDLKAQSLPSTDEATATKAAIEKLQADLAAEKEARISNEQMLAELKDKPGIDPDSDHIAHDRLSRMKTVPEVQTLVRETPQDENEKAAQQVWDNLHTLSFAFCDRDTGRPRNVKSLGYWQKLQTIAPGFAKALDTATTAEGTEWAPTEYSSQLVDAIFDDVVVPNIFTRFTMNRSPLVLPFSLTGGTAYLAGEATSDSPSEYTATTPATYDNTFTAKKLAMLINFSEELEEETIVPLLPQLQFTIRRTLGEGIEDAILDGDTTATHQDSDVTSSADRRKAWDGIRDWLIANTTAWKSFATFDGDNAINAVLAAMTQKYNADGVWIFPTKKKYDLITIVDDSTNKNPLILRSTQLGDGSVTSGRVPDLLGNPVVFSSRMRVNLNATGVYDGDTTTKTWAAFVNPNAWWLGDRREVRLEVERKPAAGYSRLIGTWRGAFKCVIPSGLSEIHTGGGYNY